MSQIQLPMAPPPLEMLVLEDGEPMETYRHFLQMSLLIETLEYAFRERDDFFVGGNMFFYYSATQSRKNDFRGPDVFVVLGTEHRERQAWVVWLEGGKTPDVIIELTSDSTRTIDHREKKALYAELKIGEYFIFDPFTQEFDGFELDTTGRVYRPKTADPRGRLYSNALGLWLGSVPGIYRAADAPWLRWIDERGVPVPSAFETAAAAMADAERAEARADQAEERAGQAEERAGQAEERAGQAEERAARATERETQEKERADSAEALLASYQRRFGPIGK